MHIVIIADPIDKQSAGIHYLTKHLVSQLLAIDSKNTYTIIRINGMNPKASFGNKIPQQATGNYTTAFASAAVPKFQDEGGLKKELAEDDQRTIILKNTFPFIHNDPFRTFISLPLLIRKLKPDVVIEPAHFGPFNLPKNIKRVNIIHDLSPIKFSKFHPFYSQFFQRIFFRGIIKRADLLITNSKNTSNDLIQYFPGTKIKTTQIYLGKEDQFTPFKSKDVLIKHQMKNPYFLNVGTIEPRKNLNTLLDAFAIFKQNHKTKIQLLIVGKNGWKTKSFYKQLKNHPYKNEIQMIGYVDRLDLPSLYSNALAFIYPSYYEGFGLPVLEAMACGAPSIVSNSSSLPEVGGDAVLYFNPQKAIELGEKMSLIYKNKAIQNSLRELGIKQASRFSWDKYAREFIQSVEKKFGNHKQIHK